jgi:AcrR family transcriptional regulator
MKRVRRARDAEETRRLVWQAAAKVFAAKGFDGAKVDEIAAEAGLNKAMLYYHFEDKLALYRDVLLDQFAAIAAGTEAARKLGGPPEAQLRGFVQALVSAARDRPHFPAIWLREIADGGRHLDTEVFGRIRAILATLDAILKDGARDQGWRPIQPFMVQAGVAAPLMFILATQGIRSNAGLTPGTSTDPDALAAHFTDMTLAMLSTPFRRHR